MNALLVPMLAIASFVSAQDASEARPGEVLISGRVLDPGGQPLKGVRLGTGWWFDHGRLRMYGSNVGRPANEQDGDPSLSTLRVWVTTDDEGRFAGYFETERGHVHLTLFSADDALGGSFEWKAGANLEDLNLILQPTARVQARLTCSQLGLTKVEATAYLNSVPHGLRLGRFTARTGDLDLRLPPGTYQLYIYGADLDTLRHQITVRSDRGDIDLGPLDLPAQFFALNRGKPLPAWNVTESRGVPLEQTAIENFRGKWLLIEFWGFW